MIQPKQGRQSTYDQHKHITDEGTPTVIDENEREKGDEQEPASQRHGTHSAAGRLWPARCIPDAEGYCWADHSGD
jgi:hypothetical protein